MGTGLRRPPTRPLLVVVALGLAAVALWVQTRPEATAPSPPPPTQGNPSPASTAPPLKGQVVREPSGEGLAGAEVHARASDAPLGDPIVRVVTDGGGHFTMAGLTAGDWDVTASLKGFASVTVAVTVPQAGSGPLTMRLAPAGTLRGQLMAEPSTPIRQGRVSVVGSGIWPPIETAARPDGSFIFEEVPEGVYVLRAEAEGLVSRPTEGLVLEPGGTREVVMHLEPAVTLRGRVIDALGDQGIPKAHVWIREGPISMMARTTTTDGTGAFEVTGLRRGEYRLSAFAPGYVSTTPIAVAAPGAAHTVRLEPAGTVVGTVRDGSGRAVPGAVLEVVGQASQTGLPVNLVADPGAEDLSDNDARHAPLVPAGHLGITLGGVPPIAAVGGGPDAPRAPGLYVSGPDGSFRLAGVPAGDHRVVARHRGFAPGASAPLSLSPGGLVENVDVILAEGGAVLGRVQHQSGTAVGGVTVTLLTDMDPVARDALTDGRGAFRFDGVAGKGSVSVSAAGLPKRTVTFEVQGTETVEVRLVVDEVLTQLRGRAVDERGFPVAGARVRLEGGGVRGTETNGEGLFAFAAVGAPPLTLRVDHEAFARVAMKLNRVPEDELRVVLTSPVVLVGRVVDGWSGKPLVKAEVKVTSPHGITRTTTGGDGTFRLPRTGAGRLTVVVGESDHATLTRVLDLEPPRYADEIDLGDLGLEPAAVIEGTVVDDRGDAVAGARVSLEGVDGGPATTTTGSGAFRLGRVPAGRHTLVAAHARGGTVREGPLRLAPGEHVGHVQLKLPEPVTP